MLLVCNICIHCMKWLHIGKAVCLCIDVYTPEFTEHILMTFYVSSFIIKFKLSRLRLVSYHSNNINLKGELLNSFENGSMCRSFAENLYHDL